MAWNISGKDNASKAQGLLYLLSVYIDRIGATKQDFIKSPELKRFKASLIKFVECLYNAQPPDYEQLLASQRREISSIGSRMLESIGPLAFARDGVKSEARLLTKLATSTAFYPCFGKDLDYGKLERPLVTKCIRISHLAAQCDFKTAIAEAHEYISKCVDEERKKKPRTNSERVKALLERKMEQLPDAAQSQISTSKPLDLIRDAKVRPQNAKRGHSKNRPRTDDINWDQIGPQK